MNRNYFPTLAILLFGIVTMLDAGPRVRILSCPSTFQVNFGGENHIECGEDGECPPDTICVECVVDCIDCPITSYCVPDCSDCDCDEAAGEVYSVWDPYCGYCRCIYGGDPCDFTSPCEDGPEVKLESLNGADVCCPPGLTPVMNPDLVEGLLVGLYTCVLQDQDCFDDSITYSTILDCGLEGDSVDVTVIVCGENLMPGQWVEVDDLENCDLLNGSNTLIEIQDAFGVLDIAPIQGADHVRSHKLYVAAE